MSKFKLKVSSRLLKKKVRKQSYLSQKHCRFCADKEQEQFLDYKNANLLKSFLTERGKILPSRVSGNCFFHQRQLANQIKIARSMALLPYCSINR
ncbi:30S ribosomal protein S18 [Candidatus Dependentiae bacterium]|nr:30S ribosomal protein S18 [Candidatus Dependentiae bacterium]